MTLSCMIGEVRELVLRSGDIAEWYLVFGQVCLRFFLRETWSIGARRISEEEESEETSKLVAGRYKYWWRQSAS